MMGVVWLSAIIEMMQYRPLTDLEKLPGNPRTITKEDMDTLKQSIQDNPDYFEARPLILSNRTGKLVILGGNQRYEAAKALKLTDVPTHLIEGLTEEREQEIIIRDNVANGEWDYDVLANEWSDLPLAEWGVELPELHTNVEPEEDEAPEVSTEPPKSELGKIYQLGRHRVMCGDSTVKENVDLLMAGNKADMVYADPPYGMNLDADYSKMNGKLEFVKDKHLKSKTGNKYANVIGDHADFDPKFISVLLEIGENCKEVFLWGADYYAELLPNKNDGSWFVWDKRLDESSDKMYGSTFELVWSKSKHKRSIVRIKWAGVFGTEQEFDRKRHHPTQKPINLSAYFIENYSEKEDRIVDLFLGSGSTLIACEQTDRICYGMELDPQYVDVIRKRYATYMSADKKLPDNWEELTPEIR